jgi:cyclase
LISRIADRYGSQAVIVAIDAKRTNGEARCEAYVSGGRHSTGRDAVEWAREAEERGAGEILLTSMDRDGTGAGFGCELTRACSEALHIPVIASGGGGDTQTFVDVFQRGKADAALAASIFHFGLHSVGDLKRELQNAGIAVRWPC